MMQSLAGGRVQTSLSFTLAVRQGSQAVEFYKRSFGATEVHRAESGIAAPPAAASSARGMRRQPNAHSRRPRESPLRAFRLRAAAVGEDAYAHVNVGPSEDRTGAVHSGHSDAVNAR